MALRLTSSEGDTGMAKRELRLIESKPGDKRYVRRDEARQFTKEQDHVGRRKAAKHVAPRGKGDRGDRKFTAN